MNKEVVIAEIQRVAHQLQVRSLSRNQFIREAHISAATVEATFGTWNEAVKAAGLIPLPQGGLPKTEEQRLNRLVPKQTTAVARQAVSDEELLEDLLRLERELGRPPSGNQIAAKGTYSPDTYKKRWGSVAAAREEAHRRQADRA